MANVKAPKAKKIRPHHATGIHRLKKRRLKLEFAYFFGKFLRINLILIGTFLNVPD